MEESPYAVSDVSRAIQDMILTAWEQGVGSNWVGFGNLGQVNAVLDIPAEIKIMAIVPFGYPVKKRKPFGEVIYREKWGKPFE